MPADGQGFTILELVISTSILLIVVTLIFANYPNFQESISLKKTAQEIALTIRQAQTYGLGVREFKEGSGIFPGYGVHFDIASPDSLVLFADVNGDDIYFVGDGCSSINTECVQSFKIQSREKLSSFCANEKNPPSAGCNFNTIDVIFLRPDPLVTIKADGSDCGSKCYDGEIKIVSLRDQTMTRTIVILSTGQISVE